jgi:TonB family protein
MTLAPFFPLSNYRRSVVLAWVIILHIAVIWGIAESLPVVRIGDDARVTQVDLLRPSAGSPEPDPAIILPTFTQPLPVGVSEPTIEIAQEPQPVSTLTALDLSQLLAPRPDPRHINMQPQLPDRFKNLGSSASTILTIFVEPDGSVSAAQIAQSSGASQLDAWAIAYVEANWRFIPALAHGHPVADWTTVIVRFSLGSG